MQCSRCVLSAYSLESSPIMNMPPPSDTPDQDVPEMHPGDDAPPGTPGTGEDICPKCHGTGTLNGADCQNCGGTGKIVEGIGGG